MPAYRVTTVALAGVLAAALLHAQAPPPPAGRGRGAVGAPQSAGRRGPNFPQQTRELAAPEVIARGKAVYGVNCTACHGADLRGGDQGGPSLLRSLVALSDQHGEIFAPIIRGGREAQGMPAFKLTETDITAVAEYVHSVLANVGTQARPPGAMDPATLNVLVGDANAGSAYFQSKCASCHSVSGDLKGIATKYPEPRQLQNTWVAGGAGGGRRGGNEGGVSVTVTLANGQNIEGTLVRKDDFLVTLTTAGGARQSVARDGDNPKVEIRDPRDAHKKLLTLLDDKDMHDVTAYLATVK